MNRNFKLWTVAALPLIAMSVSASAAPKNDKNAKNNTNDCAPTAPAPCYQADNCACTYCLGPDNVAVNAAVRPYTCNGDFEITIAGFYWNAHMDGMEYAVNNHVAAPGQDFDGKETLPLNNLVGAQYLTPNFQWNWGFKAGLGYNSACDGWDIGAVWTWYQGRANDTASAEPSDNQTLLPLWSAFAPVQGNVLFASGIDTSWKLKLNLVDLELGREFWSSKYITLRPFIGLRFAWIDQQFTINHKGGSWGANDATTQQPAFNGAVDLSNKFKGIGVRAGLNSVWNFGCGWGLYGNLAASIVYGRFTVNHTENNQNATDPTALPTKVLETNSSFHASRGMLDLGLGVQWATQFRYNRCQYGFAAMLGWENHLFFNQNQMWRVVRIGDTAPADLAASAPTSQVGAPISSVNNSGQNVFSQRRGDLDTQGWTLTLRFDF